MSNDNAGEKPAHRKPKVSYATLIGVGLVGHYGEAEMRSRCETGEYSCTDNYCDGMTEKANQEGCWFTLFKHVGWNLRQIRDSLRLRCDDEAQLRAELMMPCFQEKSLSFR